MTIGRKLRVRDVCEGTYPREHEDVLNFPGKNSITIFPFGILLFPIIDRGDVCPSGGRLGQGIEAFGSGLKHPGMPIRLGDGDGILMRTVLLDTVISFNHEQGQDVGDPFGIVPNRLRKVAKPTLEVGSGHTSIAPNVHVVVGTV